VSGDAVIAFSSELCIQVVNKPHIQPKIASIVTLNKWQYIKNYLNQRWIFKS
jgi:hypothetical protein